MSVVLKLYDAQDEPIDTSGEPVTYLHGGYGDLLEALEQALEGRAVGESIEVRLEPGQAFGEYDAELVRVEPRSRYGEGLEVGMDIEDAFDTREEPRLYVVTDLAGDHVVLDGNHPLAGRALRFSCRILRVRPATDAEIKRGAAQDGNADRAHSAP